MAERKNIIETETKFPEIDVKALEHALEKNRAQCVFAGLLRDRFYDTISSSLDKEGCMLRVRAHIPDDGEPRYLVTYKGRTKGDKKFKKREELEFQVHGNGDSIDGVLAGLGYSCRFKREKHRASYLLALPGKEKVSVEIDKYPNLPAMCEIEGGEKQIEDAAKLLGLDISAAVARIQDFYPCYDFRNCSFR